MKNIIILIACVIGLTFMTSCGKREIGTQLGQFGESMVHDLGKGIEFIGQQPKHFSREILGINEDKVESDNRDDYLQNEIDSLSSTITALYSTVGDLSTDQDILEQDIALLTGRLAELENNNSIVEFIDPCGDNDGQFDEVIMVTSNGDYVAYFESRGKRFLTVLPNGSYRTTDSQRCNFTITNGIYNE